MSFSVSFSRKIYRKKLFHLVSLKLSLFLSFVCHVNLQGRKEMCLISLKIFQKYLNSSVLCQVVKDESDRIVIEFKSKLLHKPCRLMNCFTPIYIASFTAFEVTSSLFNNAALHVTCVLQLNILREPAKMETSIN